MKIDTILKNAFLRLNSHTSQKYIYIAIFFVVMIAGFENIKAQQVKYLISEITTTMKHYSYEHILTATTKKDIDYFIIEAPNGSIKTAFDACDVCWGQYKGYSQRGAMTHCNNCTKEYPTNEIGTNHQSGCWPGYLPHTEVEGEVVINVSDLLAGAYFFRTEAYTGIIDDEVGEMPDTYMLTVINKALSLQMPVSVDRKINVYDINGNILLTQNSSNLSVSFDMSGLAHGTYIITILEGKKQYRRLFVV